MVAVITTVWGTGQLGFPDLLNTPNGLAVDTEGDVYISDFNNHRICRWERRTGTLRTVAGHPTEWREGFGGDSGPATEATLNCPMGVALDSKGNFYVADAGNDRYRKVDGSTGVITTEFELPDVGFGMALAVDRQDHFYFCGEGKIRRRDARTGEVRVVAGRVQGSLATDAYGNLFVAVGGQPRVRKMDAVSKTWTDVAGTGETGFSGDGGPATEAQLGSFIPAIAVDATGRLFIADYKNQCVRRVDPFGRIDTVAGTGEAGYGGDGGPATEARLNGPHGLATDPSGNLYIADENNHAVRKVSFSSL